MSSGNAAVMALDYGDKRIGVAMASLTSRLASPLVTLNNDASMLTNLESLIKQNNVTVLVVGYPRNQKGQPTQQTHLVEQFIERLKQFNLTIKLQDESLTSVYAEAELKAGKAPYTKKDVDALAATYILEDYLSTIN
jgi:putative Holliday junction resolvase